LDNKTTKNQSKSVPDKKIIIQMERKIRLLQEVNSIWAPL